jgi:hypothetical protein
MFFSNILAQFFISIIRHFMMHRDMTRQGMRQTILLRAFLVYSIMLKICYNTIVSRMIFKQYQHFN